jgi:dUTP pyrophosphatase
MLAPTFYVKPGDEQFVPQVAHPHEDAGADVKAYVPEFNPEEIRAFYMGYHRLPPVASVSLKAHLHLDGRKFTGDLGTFLRILETAGGAVLLKPGETVLVDSGFKLLLPKPSELKTPFKGFVPVYQIVPRSGLACKHNIVVTNSPGIIDSGYRDWVKVSLTNNGKNYHAFSHGARIAQGLYSLVIDQTGNQVTTSEEAVDESQRGEGGFGSTAL